MTIPPPLEGADKMTAPYIEIYTKKTRLYGHLYGH